MTQKYAGKMRIIVSALTLCLVAQQSILLSASAGMITGVKPEAGADGNIYNINPSVNHGDVGFRLYNNFVLNEGEIANLIYKYKDKDISTFVNLVNEQININGLVNTVRDGNFYNGHAIFVSPNGMVVGASGVLNVGSLSVLTPDQNQFDKFKSDYEINGDLTPLYSEGKGTVTVNGKVMARNAVDIRAAAVDVANNAAIMAGVKTLDNITTNAQANALFNSLVKTDNMTSGNAFASENGSIKITSYSGDGGVNLAAGTSLKNFGKGNIEITNKGSKGISMNGEIKNPAGDILITNSNGNLNINKGASIQHKSHQDNKVNIINSGNQLYIDDAITSENGTVNIKNTGNGGLHIDKNAVITENVNHDGQGHSAYERHNPEINISNNSDASLDIDGNIVLNGGRFHITNDGKGGLNINKTASIDGTQIAAESTIINNGEGDLNIDGSINYDNGSNNISFLDAGLTIENNNVLSGLNISETATINAENTNHTYITNNGEKGMTISGKVINGHKSSENFDSNLEITNTRGGLTIDGSIENRKGDLIVNNTGEYGLYLNGTIQNKEGNSDFYNENDGLYVNGTVTNAVGEMTFTNEGDKGLNIYSNVKNTGTKTSIINKTGLLNIADSALIENENDILIDNSGNKGLLIAGTVNNNGNSEIINADDGALTISGKYNNGKNFTAKNDGQQGLMISGVVKNQNGTVELTNTKTSLTIDGTVENEQGNFKAVNSGHNGMRINGTVNNKNGNSDYINENCILTVNGTATNAGGTMNFDNSGVAIKVNETGVINSDGILTMTNSGPNGINIAGMMNVQNGTATITNTGAKGITVTSTGRITDTTDKIAINNNAAGGITVQGLINGVGVDINNSNSDVVIGDTTANENYITSNGDININIDNGNLYNSGVDKTLLKTTNNGKLNINVTDGNIGEEVGNKAGISTGVDPNARDFTKSINVDIEGAITAKALQKSKTEDLIVNIASRGKDLKVDHIKADGKVILTADFDKDGNSASILNASTDNTKANVEGKGISLIASNSIGSSDKKLTFNQTEGKFNKEGLNIDELSYAPTAKYGFDALAIKDINIKGQDDKYDTNVTTMISREGSINAEFSGDTYIKEVTADKELNLVTRGAEMVIDNLGTVPDTPIDYYGPNGDIAPDTVIVKALDINPNTRVDNSGLVDGVHNHWANSHIIIKNGRINDDAKVELTGDDVYAGGYHFYMGKERNEDGKTYWVYDDRTAMVTTSGNDKPTIRVNSVREKDVTEIGRKEEERNYYTGGSVQEDKPWYGDDDDDDDDHLIVPEPDEPAPGDDDDDDDDGPVIPGDDDDDDDDDGPVIPGDDDDDNIGATFDDAKQTYKKEYSDALGIVDKRQYMRFPVEGNRNPVQFESNGQIASLVDISRGGVAVRHNHTLKVGDVIPVKISYGNLDIDTNVKVVTATTNRAGAEFVDLDQSTANKLLYLNLLLEEANSTISMSDR